MLICEVLSSGKNSPVIVCKNHPTTLHPHTCVYFSYYYMLSSSVLLLLLGCSSSFSAQLLGVGLFDRAAVTIFFTFCISLLAPSKLSMQGISRPPWGKSSEKCLFSVVQTLIRPFLPKKREQTEEIFCGMWLTVTRFLTIPTANGSAWLRFSCWHSRCSPILAFVNVVVSHARLHTESLHLSLLHVLDQNSHHMSKVQSSHTSSATNFKTTKFNSGGFFQLFTKTSTHKNNPLYGIVSAVLYNDPHVDCAVCMCSSTIY